MLHLKGTVNFGRKVALSLGRADGPRLTVRHRNISSFSISLPPVPFVGFMWDCCPLIGESATGPFSRPALLTPILFSDKIPILLQNNFYLLLLRSIKMNALNEWIKPFTNIILYDIICLLRIYFFCDIDFMLFF